MVTATSFFAGLCTLHLKMIRRGRWTCGGANVAPQLKRDEAEGPTRQRSRQSNKLAAQEPQRWATQAEARFVCSNCHIRHQNRLQKSALMTLVSRSKNKHRQCRAPTAGRMCHGTDARTIRTACSATPPSRLFSSPSSFSSALLPVMSWRLRLRTVAVMKSHVAGLWPERRSRAERAETAVTNSVGTPEGEGGG